MNTARFKAFLGLAMILAGLLFAAYVGVWLCFIGGIVQIIEEVKSPESVHALTIAFGVARIFFAGIVGAICAIVGVIPGLAVLHSA